MILLGVLAVHLAVVALLMTAAGIGRHQPVLAEQAVELLYLPPNTIPKVRADNAPPRHLSGVIAMPEAPPVLDSSSLPVSAASASNGDGAGVDWSAEARRAVQAFEIRTHRPPHNDSISGGPAEENWWPRHRAGEQYKTANGDWIVWVNEKCYRVASAAAGASLPGAELAPTFCPPGRPGSSR